MAAQIEQLRMENNHLREERDQQPRFAGSAMPIPDPTNLIQRPEKLRRLELKMTPEEVESDDPEERKKAIEIATANWKTYKNVQVRVRSKLGLVCGACDALVPGHHTITAY
jgi:hypothetical protein